LGRFAGVPITVGPSWLLVVPIVGLALFAGIEPRLGETWQRGLVAGFGTVLLFASVLVHELGHAFEARRRGIAVERVVVFLFGGYSEMDLDGADPIDDVAVSAAGPIASGALALATLVVAVPAPEWAGAQRTLALLGLVNIGVAVFNLLPGFPLDGGRMVRASLIGAGYDRRRADVITARLGVALGVGAVVSGVWMSIVGEAGAIVALPVGVLVLVIAGAAHPRREERVGEIMRPAADPVAETDSVAAIPADAGPVPVVAAGRVVGFVDAGAGGLVVGEAMSPVGPLDVVDVAAPARVARERVGRTGRPVAVVHRGRLVGIVEPDPLDEHEEI
jgi:Zn-dependent protease